MVFDLHDVNDDVNDDVHYDVHDDVMHARNLLQEHNKKTSQRG
jgi:hypothetical protein